MRPSPRTTSVLARTEDSREILPARYQEVRGQPASQEWIRCPGSIVAIGYDGKGFAFDNEASRPKVYLQDYLLASNPQGWQAPGYGKKIEGHWQFTGIRLAGDAL